MLRFYAKYAAERVPGRQVDQILRSWAGREADLWSKMIERYGAEPTEEEGSELLASVLSNQLPPEEPLVPENAQKKQRKLTLAFAKEKLSNKRRASTSTSTSASASTSAPAPASSPAPAPSPQTASPASPRSAAPRPAPKPIPAPPEPVSTCAEIALNGERLGCSMRERSDGTLLILSVVSGSPAHTAGLTCFQRIHSCNGTPVCALKDLAELVKANDTITLTVSLEPRCLKCANCGSASVSPESATAFVCTRCSVASTVEGEDFLMKIVPCRPCPDTGADLGFDGWRLRILRYYAKWANERVRGRQVDQILRSWSGREDELWEKLVERYGAPPTDEEGDELLSAVLSSAQPPDDEASGAASEEAMVCTHNVSNTNLQLHYPQ